MQIQKSQKLLLAVIVIFVIVTFLSTFILTGCGRRARVIAAMENAGQTEEQKDVSRTGNANENGKTDTEETVKESAEENQSTETKKSTEIDKSSGSEDNDTTETEESTGDEETTVSESTEAEETSSSESTEETTEDEETTVSESTEETTAEVKTEYTANMPYVRAECINIVGGEFVWDQVAIIPGDTGENDLEIRGFMSYDISQLLGAAIKSATISGKADLLLGTPVATYGPMFIKSVYWGARAISPSEFDLNGTEITNISKTNFIKSPAALKDNLQVAVNHARTRYQLCFYFKMSQTDGDGESDYIQYSLPDIILTVTYLK